MANTNSKFPNSKISKSISMMIKKVSVIGAGTMGNGIAHVFAQNNFEVNLVDVNAMQIGTALQTIAKNFAAPNRLSISS